MSSDPGVNPERILVPHSYEIYCTYCKVNLTDGADGYDAPICDDCKEHQCGYCETVVVEDLIHSEFVGQDAGGPYHLEEMLCSRCAGYWQGGGA